MNRITFTPKRGLMTGLATMALALGAVFVAAPVAGAAPDCSISRYQNPDGSVDTTGYLQCTSPSVSAQTVAPGGTITFRGGGFASNSTITITLSPSSQVLGTATTDANGGFAVEVTIPSNTAEGTHTLEASGVDPDGNPLVVSQTITVSSGESAEVLGTSVTPTGALPFTGSDVGRTFGIGLAAVVVGGAAVWGARRSRASRAA